MGNRLQRQDRLAVDRPVEPCEQALGMGEEEIGQLRLVGAAARLAIIAFMVSKPWASFSAMASCASVTSRTGNFTASPERPRGSPCPSQRS